MIVILYIETITCVVILLPLLLIVVLKLHILFRMNYQQYNA